MVRTLRELGIGLATIRRVLARETSIAEVAAAHADADPEVAELIRTTMPELPEYPDSSQVQAWMDLVELIGDEDFRAAVRRMAEYQAAERASGDTTGLHHELTVAVGDRARRALAAGIVPASPAAADIVSELSRRYAETFDRSDGPERRHWILNRLEIANDLRVERYWQLVGAVNGWPPAPELGPVFTWFAAALRVGLR